MIKNQSKTIALKSQIKFKNTTVCFVGNDSSGVIDSAE